MKTAIYTYLPYLRLYIPACHIACLQIFGCTSVISLIAPVQVWNLDTFEREKTILAHDNPIGTLVAAKGMLFGGSLKVIKVSLSCIMNVMFDFNCFWFLLNWSDFHLTIFRPAGWKIRARMPCVMIDFTFTTFRHDYVSNLSTLSLMVRQHPVRNNCTTATMPEILLW